jgi:hypothetical protein
MFLVGCSQSESQQDQTAASTAATPATEAASASDGIPRTPWGKPDLSGIWQRPYVPDMSVDNGRNQFGPGELPMTEAGRINYEEYNGGIGGDYTGSCLPFGLTRSMNSPDPIQFMQTEDYFAFLYEQDSWYKVVHIDGQDHSLGIPTWFGTTVANWDGDTLVMVTTNFNGKTRLDTRGHPHSDQMTVTERFTRMDPDTLEYEVTIDDPIYYTEPWSNRRIFKRQTAFDLIEYACMEGNKSLWEGRIVPPDYTNHTLWHTSDDTEMEQAAKAGQ